MNRSDLQCVDFALERHRFEHRFELPGRESPLLVTGSGIGYTVQEFKGQHDGDGSSGADGDGSANSHECAALASLAVVARFHLWQEGCQGRKLCDIAGEGVEEAYGSVMVTMQE